MLTLAEEEAYRTSEVVTGLYVVTAKLGELAGRPARADDINGALKTLLARDERATEALVLERALKAERAATLRNIMLMNSFLKSLVDSGICRVEGKTQ